MIWCTELSFTSSFSLFLSLGPDSQAKPKADRIPGEKTKNKMRPKGLKLPSMVWLILLETILLIVLERVSSLYGGLASTRPSRPLHALPRVTANEAGDLGTECVPTTTGSLIKNDMKMGAKFMTVLWGVTGLAPGAGAKGYKAAQSAYAPQSRAVLYRAPLLAQSALLNSLPFKNELIGQVQAYLESFLQLTNPSKQQKAQLASNSSVLWTNLKINAQRAAGMFLYNRGDLTLSSDAVGYGGEVSSGLGFSALEKSSLNDLTRDILKLVNASRQANVKDSLVQMKCSLKHLCTVSSYLIEIDQDSLSDVGPLSHDYLGIPRLKGRATVNLSFGKRRLGIPSEEKVITLIVDGTNYPLSAGSFIELCKSNFYETLPVKNADFDLPELDGESITGFKALILGNFEPGYRDPYTTMTRRVPLETLRSEVNGSRSTVTGAARNSAVFTRAQSVYSFATPGAVALLHPLGDRNGGSASIFAIPPKSKLTREILEKIDKRFAIFAFIVEGLEVLNQLEDDDVLLRSEVQPGPWKLVRLERDDSTVGMKTNVLASGFADNE